jgi:hypothetical protein
MFLSAFPTLITSEPLPSSRERKNARFLLARLGLSHLCGIGGFPLVVRYRVGWWSLTGKMTTESRAGGSNYDRGIPFKMATVTFLGASEFSEYPTSPPEGVLGSRNS